MPSGPTFTNEPFAAALKKLLEERKMSMTALAADLGIDHSFLSRALRGKNYKRVSPELMARIDEKLGLPAGYFAEEREAVVIDRIRNDPALRDRLYRRLRNT